MLQQVYSNAIPASMATMTTAKTQRPSCVSTANSIHQRLIAILDQVQSIRTSLEPSNSAESTGPRPVRAGVFGTLMDASETLVAIEKVVTEIGEIVTG